MPPTVFRDGGHPRSAQGRMHFPASRHRNGFLGHAKWVRAWDADFPPCPLAFLADGLSRASLEVALKSFETFSRSKQPPGNVSSTVLKRFGAMLGDVFPEHFNIGPPSKTYRITRSRGSLRCPHAVRSAPPRTSPRRDRTGARCPDSPRAAKIRPDNTKKNGNFLNLATNP